MSERALNYVSEPEAYLERAKAYGSCVGGRRFSVAHQTPGTTVTGQTSFVATTPTFLINQAAAAHRAVLSNFALCQIGTRDDPTTISTVRVRIGGGAVVFGEVWARDTGEVVSDHA